MSMTIADTAENRRNAANLIAHADRKAPRAMTIYVIEIDGRSIAAFRADTRAHANVRMRDRAFRDDLMVLAPAAGRCGTDWPTCDPPRPAGEEATWRASQCKAIREGSIAGDDDEWIAFLVALTIRTVASGDDRARSFRIGADQIVRALVAAGIDLGGGRVDQLRFASKASSNPASSNRMPGCTRFKASSVT